MERIDERRLAHSFHRKPNLLNLRQHYRILVVDDDAIFLVEFEDLLKEHGFRIYTAIDGEACLDMVDRIKPHLILLDIAMPRVDGFGLLRIFQANPDLKHIPVAVISGKTSERDIPTDCRSRISAFFSKPFELKALLKELDQLLLGVKPSTGLN